MRLVLVGVNHKTAPLAVRERVAIPRSELAETMQALAAEPGISECMIVSTCNRVEMLVEAEGDVSSMGDFLARRFDIRPADLEPHLYRHEGLEAIGHLFRVAASLDSMVVGEPQILGQVKDAFAAARAAGTVGGELEHLMQSAFAAAKKIRSETGIGSNTVSVASVGVDLARKIFGDLRGRTVFLVGAGKMSELAARHLVQQGADRILVANRTEARARELAEPFGGKVVPMEKMYEAAAQADIIITSTSAPHAIFGPGHGSEFLEKRRNRPMFFIDLAVPRDVDPAMGKLEGIFVYDIDDLQQVAASHKEERNREAIEAEEMIAAEVERFELKKRSTSAAPAIVALREKAEEMRQAELRHMLPRLGELSELQMAAVESLTRGLLNKFLHPPMQALKEAAREHDHLRMEALCSTWDLPLEPEDEHEEKE